MAVFSGHGTLTARGRPELALFDQVCEGIGPGTPVHVILDNVSSHKPAEADDWPKGHEG